MIPCNLPVFGCCLHGKTKLEMLSFWAFHTPMQKKIKDVARYAFQFKTSNIESTPMASELKYYLSITEP